MLTVQEICSSYFKGFHEVIEFPRNGVFKNVLAIMKIASYALIVMPLGYGIIWGVASLTERVCKKSEPTVKKKQVENKAQTIVNPIQIEESKIVRNYTGDPTSQEKAQMQATLEEGKLTIAFPKYPAVSLAILRKDLFESGAQVIVNAANTHLGGGGGIDGLIHSKGGVAYAKAHNELCKQYNGQYISGHAAMIESGALKERYQIDKVIVVAGPSGESTPLKEQQLYSCYYNALLLAHSQVKTSIAFPSISTGIYSFPKERAAAISLKAIFDFVVTNPDTKLATFSIHFLPNDPQSNLDIYYAAAKV